MFAYIYMVSHISIKYEWFIKWYINRTQTGTTTPDQCGLGSNGNKEVLHTSELEPNHQIQFSIIPRVQNVLYKGGITVYGCHLFDTSKQNYQNITTLIFGFQFFKNKKF